MSIETTRVQISSNEKGLPSLKINGVEHNMLIGNEVTLHHGEDAHGNTTWDLTVTFPGVEVDADVEARVIAS